jgi:hypothetical protein
MQRKIDFDAVNRHARAIGIIERDQALDLLAATRQYLIDVARSMAKSISRRRGRVTSTEVRELMAADDDLRALMADVDQRFIGAVFRRGRWCHLGTEQTGSHARAVSIWRWEGDDKEEPNR